jgi:hypothetical protein
MDEFETKLGAMVAKELTGTAEDIGALIERLTDALGMAIAVASGGNAEAADKLLTGAEGYLAEAIAHHEKLARFMAVAGYRRERSGE